MPGTVPNTALPIDAQGAPVQILSPLTITGDTVDLDPGSASANVALPTGSQVIRYAASVECWIIFGFGSAATATAAAPSMYFPVGAETMAVPRNAVGTLGTHLSVIRQGSTSGEGTVTRMK